MTAFTDEVRETVSPWKFGGSVRATAMWLSSMDQGQDEDGGSTEWRFWFARFGRNVLFTDDRGFVWAEKYTNEDEAIDRCFKWAEEWCAWEDQTDE